MSSFIRCKVVSAEWQQAGKIASWNRNFELLSLLSAYKTPAFLPRSMSSFLSSIVGNAEQSQFFFRQLFDRTSYTYTYLLADTRTKEAILIDPVMELCKRDLGIIKDLGLKLKYCMNTHVHADHVTGTGLLNKLIPSCRSIISQTSGAKADILVSCGDLVRFGKYELEVRQTPGHTNGCVTYVCHSQSCAFTGDAVLIRGCGRTDFQEGNSSTLFDSVWSQVFSLPDRFKLFPAHDYKGQTETSVAEEKLLNPRLTRSKEEFIKIMGNLKLDYPEMIDVAVPANKVCGLYELPENLKKLLKDVD